MTWPYDARDFTFAAGLYVPSSTLNEIQDRIIECFEDRWKVIRHAVSTETSGTLHFSQYNSTYSAGGWTQLSVGRLMFLIELPEGSVLNSVYLKMQNNSGGASAAKWNLYQFDLNFDAVDPDTAPSGDADPGDIIDTIDFSSGTPTPDGEWDTRGITGLALTATQEKLIALESETTAVNDKIAGCKINYQQRTAS